MARESRSVLRVAGIALLVAATVCLLGAAVLALRARLAFQATALIKLTSPLDDGRLKSAFRQAQAKYPDRMGEPLKARANLDPGPALDFYRVTVLAETPKASAETANLLTELLSESLRGTGTETVSPLMLLDPAQPPAAPTRIHVKGILQWGLISGGGCAAAGALLLAFAATRRAPQDQPPE
jgi:hypothetical protein